MGGTINGLENLLKTQEPKISQQKPYHTLSGKSDMLLKHCCRYLKKNVTNTVIKIATALNHMLENVIF